MEDIIINGTKYKCIIERKNIRKVYIGYKNNNIVIRGPLNIKDNEILKIINNNFESLVKMIHKVDNKIRYTYENGSLIPFYGKIYKIIYSDESFIRGEFMYLNSLNPKGSYDLLAKKYGKIFYRNRIDYFINNYHLPYKVDKIVIREMKTRYGVCNIRDNKISFQLHLAVYPIECIDYIIVHELTHFKVQNHSKNFYYEVSKILPDYKYRIKKLKEVY